MSKIKKHLIYGVATGLGTGLAPWAPGTAGSLLALFIVWFFFPSSLLFQLVLLLLISAVGIWVSHWVSHDSKTKDPQIVVIDEIAGIFFTFFLIPINTWTLIAGFLLFRILDIWKPGPIGAAEKLPGGWGIMLDDILSGILGNILIHITLYWATH